MPFIILPSLMSLLLLNLKTLGNRCSQLKPPYLLSHFHPNYHGFNIKLIHQKIQTTRLHASHCHQYSFCHYCNVHSLLFHNITCYNSYLLSPMHVKATYLLNITCTSVATCMILGRLGCTTITSTRLIFIKRKHVK